MGNSRHQFKRVNNRNAPFRGKADVNHSIVGWRNVAKDAFVCDVFAQGIRNNIEALQDFFPIDPDGERGKIVSLAFGRDEKEVKFVDSRGNGNVISEIAGAPLPEQERIACPCDDALRSMALDDRTEVAEYDVLQALEELKRRELPARR